MGRKGRIWELYLTAYNYQNWVFPCGVCVLCYFAISLSCLSLRQKLLCYSVMLVLCPFGISSLFLQTWTQRVHPPCKASSPWQHQREKKCWECLYKQRAALLLHILLAAKTLERLCPLCSCWIVVQALILQPAFSCMDRNHCASSDSQWSLRWL